MINNYIKSIQINDENRYLVIYFKNKVLNENGDNLTIKNFKLKLNINNIISKLNINKIFINDEISYTIFFNINNNTIIKNSKIIVELEDIVNYNFDELSKNQYNNSIFLNYNINITPNLVINKIKKNTNSSNSYINYINKSSPLLAFNENKKKFYLEQINNYNNFYGKIPKKYPKSYYSNSYNLFYKPSL